MEVTMNYNSNTIAAFARRISPTGIIARKCITAPSVRGGGTG